MKGFRYILQYYTHQGSVAALTNRHGEFYQHLQYLPYGEVFVDKHRGSFASPYTFSAKEKDSESGYSYFGARYYTDNLMMWLSVDPMSDKYPSMSPYMYCAGNPIIFIDPNGETPRLFIEKNGVGHAFVTVGNGKNITVYTYGRYLGGDKGKSSANSLDPTGYGVLIKLTGKEAHGYIKNQLRKNNATAYEFTDASDEKVQQYFDNVFSSGRKLSFNEAKKYDDNTNNYGTSEDARIIDTYDLLKNNCVSTSINGIKAGGTKETFTEESRLLAPVIPKVQYQPISPAGMDDLLKSRTNDKKSNVINVTNKINLEYAK